MPKNIHTPRDELICGKIDIALELSVKHQDIKLIDALMAIRSDAERMEAKLISRKDEVAALQQKPAHPQDREKALKAISFCIEQMKNPRMKDDDIAIWSVGTSQKPRITITVLKEAMSALIAHRSAAPNSDGAS